MAVLSEKPTGEAVPITAAVNRGVPPPLGATSAVPMAVNRGVPPPLGATSAVPTAVALGWQMSTLYAMASGGAPRVAHPRPKRAGLPGLVSLGVGERFDLLVRQITAKARGLRDLYAAAGFDPAELDAFSTRVYALIGRWPEPPSAPGAETDPPVPVTIELDQADAGLRVALDIASARLGRAYGLGVELAEMCRSRAEAHEETFREQFVVGSGAVQDALADLASALPAHAARGVGLSLAQWSLWAQNPRLSGDPVAWPNEAVALALCRQGDVWRSVLTGEKAGRDMLTATGYLHAVRCLFVRAVKTIRPRMWIALTLSAAAVALGIYFVITAPSAWKAVSGVVLSILGTFGITVASLKRAVSGIGEQVGASMLGAELDLAIADAITVVPGDWGISLQDVHLPARGQDPAASLNARRLHELRLAVHAHHRLRQLRTAVARSRVARESRAIKRVENYLSEGCELVDLTKVQRLSESQPPEPPTHELRAGREPVAAWLIEGPALAASQVGIVVGTDGRLVSHEGDDPTRFFVWAFRAGKIASIAVADERSHAWKLAGVVTEPDPD